MLPDKQEKAYKAFCVSAIKRVTRHAPQILKQTPFANKYGAGSSALEKWSADSSHVSP